MALKVVNRGEAAARQPLALPSWEGVVLGGRIWAFFKSSHLHSRKLPGYLRKELSGYVSSRDSCLSKSHTHTQLTHTQDLQSSNSFIPKATGAWFVKQCTLDEVQTSPHFLFLLLCSDFLYNRAGLFKKSNLPVFLKISNNDIVIKKKLRVNLPSKQMNCGDSVENQYMFSF